MTEGIATINYEDFTKLDLRIATIKEAEEIEGADKLYKLTLDDGSEEPRTICAGIKEFYTKEDLQGKQIIIVANLAPRKMRGIESQGMLLAASSDDHSKVILLTPDKDIEPGSLVG
jgi:methionine--tRNA ligase beta chain